MTRRRTGTGRGSSGGPTIRRLEVSEKAARALRERASINGLRYRKEDANATITQMLELLADGRAIFLLVSDDVVAVLSWLLNPPADLPEDVRRGVDQIAAALWVAANAKRRNNDE